MFRALQMSKPITAQTAERRRTYGQPSCTMSCDALPRADVRVQVEELRRRDRAALERREPVLDADVVPRRAREARLVGAVDVDQVAPVRPLDRPVDGRVVARRGAEVRVERERREAAPAVDALRRARRGMYGITAAYGFGITSRTRSSPRSASGSTHVRHIESGSRSPSSPAQRSSSSQSPTWIVCVTMSGYEYCGTPPSIRPGWFWP